MSVRFVRTPEGRRLAYTESGTGTPLVLAAWWVGHLEQQAADPSFRRFIDRLAKRHRVVRYDRMGVGLSDRGRDTFTLEGELSDLTALLDKIGAPRVHLFGSSFGGPLAIAFAALQPERVGKVVLYGTYAEGSGLAKPEVQQAFTALVRSSWGLGSRTLADVFNPNADAPTRASYAALQRESADAETAARLLGLHYSLDATKYIPGVRAPVLVMHRRDDRAIRYELGRQLAAKLRNATFRTLEGCEHMPWEGRADAVVDATLEFLRDGTTPKAVSSGPEIHRDGEVWLLSFEGKEARVRDGKGVADLARLVARPGEPVHVLELLGSPVAQGDAEPALDEKAMRKYRERIEQLDEELAEADGHADAGRLEKLSRERELVVARLAADMGLRGRARKLNDPVERARKTVAARVRYALKRITTVHPALGKHLEQSVSTGVRCAYRPAAALEKPARAR